MHMFLQSLLSSSAAGRGSSLPGEGWARPRLEVLNPSAALWGRNVLFPLCPSLFSFFTLSKLIMCLSASVFLVPPLWTKEWKTSLGNLRGHWFPGTRPRTGLTQLPPVCRTEKLLRGLGRQVLATTRFLASSANTSPSH